MLIDSHLSESKATSVYHFNIHYPMHIGFAFEIKHAIGIRRLMSEDVTGQVHLAGDKCGHQPVLFRGRVPDSPSLHEKRSDFHQQKTID